MNTQFYDLTTFLTFIAQKKAMFVITSERTGQAFTFRFRYPSGKEKGTQFIQYRGGDGRFLYLGNYDPEERKVYLTRKTNPYMRYHPATLALMWIFQCINLTDRLPDRVRIHHEGKCARCGRALTDPLSVKRGIGPECIKAEVRHHFSQATLPGLEARGPRA